MGKGKAKKSFLHPFCLSLISFLTFLLSLTLSCGNISGSDSLCSTWAAVVYGMCNWLPLGFGSLQLRDIWEKISLESHMGWQSRGLKQHKRKMFFAHGGASVSTKGGLSFPVCQGPCGTQQSWRTVHFGYFGSKQQNSEEKKKIYLRFAEVSMFSNSPLRKKKPMKTFSLSMSLLKNCLWLVSNQQPTRRTVQC